ncbi:GNAT family N-acetyltransferase [Amycolatopsis sp. SID8362]|uniref:GNAT family N-acetyltransferase n=1 Tax=Amycolatopsis sp. SID8362 TaxID=2690346 RepID=UPI0028163EE3|nr:GNAT family N-acetyltransferase [Amycolatopsis sp. SID8362]
MADAVVGQVRRLVQLDKLINAFGEEAFLTDHFHRQQAGRGVLFAAWIKGRAAGVVYLRLEKAEEKKIDRHLKGVPQLTHLEVLGKYRNRGVGRTLIKAVEQHAAELGHERITLAVRTDNDGAARLYKHLGYEDWGHHTVTCRAYPIPAKGWFPKRERETCYVLVKNITSVMPAPAPLAEPAVAAFA